MSVVKSKRKESQFEVFHHYYKVRKELTDLLLRDFGYSEDKSAKKLAKQFGGKPYAELSDTEKARHDKMQQRNQAFEAWFVMDEREVIMGYLRNLGRCLFSANEIYPQYEDELVQRRLFQEKALGYCTMLKQELQYAIETLPVDINKYTRFAQMLQTEIDLIKGWRRSDNRFKKTVTHRGCT
ncbi:MAG: hypothetical protein LIO70_01125 [Clostridiales bacterium]|nr:hypothetical protein [Clostridiales bacterium]